MHISLSEIAQGRWAKITKLFRTESYLLIPACQAFSFVLFNDLDNDIHGGVVTERSIKINCTERPG